MAANAVSDYRKGVTNPIIKMFRVHITSIAGQNFLYNPMELCARHSSVSPPSCILIKKNKVYCKICLSEKVQIAIETTVMILSGTTSGCNESFPTDLGVNEGLYNSEFTNDAY